MSLDWSLGKIEGYKDLCWVPSDDGGSRLNPVTNALIWNTMVVEIGKITEKNYEEFYARMVTAFDYESAATFYEWKGGKARERIPTLEDVKAHIGLSTNAGTARPKVRDWKKKVKRWENDRKREGTEVVYPEDVLPEDLTPEQSESMGIVRA